MFVPRIYQNIELIKDTEILLSEDATHHVLRVLRLKQGQDCILFNGNGYDFTGTLNINSNKAKVYINNFDKLDNELEYNCHLGQAIINSNAMDFALQKAVELGVSSITPLITEKLKFKLTKEAYPKKYRHWNKVIISACEQSGRAILPSLHMPLNYSQLISKHINGDKFILQPDVNIQVRSFNLSKNVTFIVGPESGWSEDELKLAMNYNWTACCLTKTTLRAETAALTFLSTLWG